MQKIHNVFKLQSVDKFNHLPKVSNFTYNYLLGCAMMYMTTMILSGLLVYKIVEIGPFMAPTALFVTPIIYSLSNVTTEVYGYQVGRNMLWWFIIASAFFTFCSGLLIKTPSAALPEYQSAYDLILGSMPRIFVAGTIGTLCGITFNNYLVSKLKISMNGKNYWFRSFIATSSGQVLYNAIAYPIMHLGHVPTHKMLHIIVCASLFKVTATMVFLPFECWLARYLKIKENINVFDHNVNYDIFRFKLAENSKPTLRIVKNNPID